MRRFDSCRTPYRSPRAQRGVVLFVSLILLLILTLLGISLARMQTVEERLSQNGFNHQLALQTAQAALNAAFDDDAGGKFPEAQFEAGVTGLAYIGQEVGVGFDNDLAYHANWSNVGSDAMLYTNMGAPLASAPGASHPQFVIERMVPAYKKGCGNNVTIHRITAHSAGGDGSASATVQIIRIGNC
jgi:type IV pilus assembly protein PilX